MSHNIIDLRSTDESPNRKLSFSSSSSPSSSLSVLLPKTSVSLAVPRTELKIKNSNYSSHHSIIKSNPFIEPTTITTTTTTTNTTTSTTTAADTHTSNIDSCKINNTTSISNGNSKQVEITKRPFSIRLMNTLFGSSHQLLSLPHNIPTQPLPHNNSNNNNTNNSMNKPNEKEVSSSPSPKTIAATLEVSSKGGCDEYFPAILTTTSATTTTSNTSASAELSHSNIELVPVNAAAIVTEIKETINNKSQPSTSTSTWWKKLKNTKFLSTPNVLLATATSFNNNKMRKNPINNEDNEDEYDEDEIVHEITNTINDYDFQKNMNSNNSNDQDSTFVINKKSNLITRQTSNIINNGISNNNKNNNTFFTRIRLKRPAMPFLNISSRQNIYRTPKSIPIAQYKNRENVHM